MNIAGNRFYGKIDLTEDQRYTLSAPVSDMLENMEDEVNVRIFMTAEFLPADFKRFKQSIIEKLEDFQAETDKVTYFFEDPNEGEIEEIRARGEALRRMGVSPVRVGKNQQGQDVYVFPGAVFEGRDTVVVNLMVNEIPGMDKQTVINESISLLEYNLADGIRKANQAKRGIVAFTEGRGELPAGEVADLDRSLRRKGYVVGRIDIDKTSLIDPQVDVLIVAKPQFEYSDRDKFILDQYIMQGGKVIWLIDRLSASLDTMLVRPSMVPFDYPLNLEDLLFKYGIRLQPNLIMDLESSKVKLVSGKMGDAAQTDIFPWYFHPTVRPFSDHPIVKNLDRVELRFASVIDTIKTIGVDIEKTVLLRTSDRSMTKFSPVELNFNFLREEPQLAAFNKKHLPVAVLYEGVFPSAYQYKATDDLLRILEKKNLSLLKESQPTKMLVVSDGDIAKNDFDPNTGKIRSLGFNRVTGIQYANKDFLMNAIEYMFDDSGIIQSKNREVKLNLLDCTRAEAEKTFWQFFNIALPLLFLIGFGFVYFFIRKRRFGKINELS